MGQVLLLIRPKSGGGGVLPPCSGAPEQALHRHTTDRSGAAADPFDNRANSDAAHGDEEEGVGVKQG